jgi:hypothetical protein
MKTSPQIPRLFLAGTVHLLAPALYAATITDKFNDPSKWGKPIVVQGDAKMSVSGGRMNYSSGTADSGTGLPRKGPLLPTTKDWSIQADAHIHPFKLTKKDQYADVFMAVGKTGDLFNTNVMFEFCRGKWGAGPGAYEIGAGVSVDGSDLPKLFSVDGLSSPDVSLRMEFSAAEKTITCLFDGNGAAGGYQWVKQGTAKVSSGRYNLKMTSKDTITVFLAASSEFQKVNKGQAWLDNLRITIGNASYSALVVQQPAGSNLTTGVSRKSFGTRPVGGSGLTRTFTLRNDGPELLTGLAVTTDGPHAADFKATPPATTLAPGESTTCKVTFTPTATGTRNAAIHIKSNDADENPFDIAVSGTGVK